MYNQEGGGGHTHNLSHTYLDTFFLLNVELSTNRDQELACLVFGSCLTKHNKVK